MVILYMILYTALGSICIYVVIVVVVLVKIKIRAKDIFISIE